MLCTMITIFYIIFEKNCKTFSRLIKINKFGLHFYIKLKQLINLEHSIGFIVKLYKNIFIYSKKITIFF